MVAAFEFERTATPFVKVSVRLSARPDRLVPADGDTPVELCVSVHSTPDLTGQELQRLVYLIDTLRDNPTDIDPSLKFVEQRLGLGITLVYRIGDLCANRIDDGFRPLMAQLDGLSRHTIEWLLKQQ